MGQLLRIVGCCTKCELSWQQFSAEFAFWRSHQLFLRTRAPFTTSTFAQPLGAHDLPSSVASWNVPIQKIVIMRQSQHVQLIVPLRSMRGRTVEQSEVGMLPVSWLPHNFSCFRSEAFDSSVGREPDKWFSYSSSPVMSVNIPISVGIVPDNALE